jgi:UDP-N-acetylglucosamine--N-acetylmuramyl-(pentapeptide) pyrophosphoryl-undecaprenol N-acetylglucosamine transferase
MSLILLTAGGTGGHVFPAEALASELTKRGHRLAMVTDRRGTHFSGALGDAQTYAVSGGGIAGKSLYLRIKALMGLGRGYMQARAIIDRLQPNAVIGFGGYASVPAVLAASHQGVPTALHEQNAVLGRANRLLAPRVKAIASSYANLGKIKEAWAGKTWLIGMPVRSSIEAVRAAPYPELTSDGPISLLVTGGSQGASAFSDLIPAALALLPEGLRSRLRLSQQCRADDLERVRVTYADMGIEADLRSFFDDVPARLAACHLAICRSGASTMAELAAVGRPAILLPYPHAIDDHQTANARAFAETGGGWLMPQRDTNAASLAAKLTEIFNDPERLRAAAAQAGKAGEAEAAVKLADLVLRLAEDRA